MESMIKANVY